MDLIPVDHNPFTPDQVAQGAGAIGADTPTLSAMNTAAQTRENQFGPQQPQTTPEGYPYFQGGPSYPETAAPTEPVPNAQPQSIPTTVTTRASPYDRYIEREAQLAGIDPNVLRRFMVIESGGDPNSRTGSYHGLFNLSYPEFVKYGGTGNIYDPEMNTRVAATKLAHEAQDFRETYQREPTPTDLYMIHQQGAGGYHNHVNNPDELAWVNMYNTAEGRAKGPAWAKAAIWGNLPAGLKQAYGSVDNVTSRDFVSAWDSRVTRGSFEPSAPEQAGDAREAAALRTARAVRPDRGRASGPASDFVSGLLDPSAIAVRQLKAAQTGVDLGRGLASGIATFPQRYTQAAEGVARGEDTGIGQANLELAGYMAGARSPFVKPGELGAGGGGRLTAPGQPVANPLQADAAAAAAPGPVKMVPVEYDPFAWTGATAHQAVERGPEDFHAAIAEAKAAHPKGAAVTLYSPEEYATMQTHTLPDGSAGYALNGDDIVSVFKHPNSNIPRAADTMLSHAFQQGGRRLDAFDTELPHIYGRNGMRAVARIPFDPQFAPEGWSYDAFRHYNGGKPDVVFMVRDPFNSGYRPGDGLKVGSYDEAVAIQKQAVKDIELREGQAKKNFEDVAKKVTGLKGAQEFLTPPEMERVTARNAQKLVDIFTTLPSGEEYASAAFAGRAKRGWYQQSANALVDIFGAADAPRFAGLLSALSPRVSVERNAELALRAWNQWVKDGRPTDVRGINNSLNYAIGRGEVLPAWRGNVIRILRASDPMTVELSGPKVNSFMQNLRGRVHEVTNDAWMANYANVDQKLVAANRVADPNPIKGMEPKIGVKSPGYLAFSAAIRRGAKVLSQKTGDVWTPAEIQETVWSWAKTLQEKAASALEDRDVQTILKAGDISHAEIANTPDFAKLFATGIYRKILKEGGYDVGTSQAARTGGRAAPSGNPTSAEGSGFSQRAFERHLQQGAQRLDQRRLETRQPGAGVDLEDTF